jgi:adenylosuccinate synthase
MLVIGSGALIDPLLLKKEADAADCYDRLYIDHNAGIIGEFRLSMIERRQ